MALRTQIDNLRWEVNLDAKNKMLRSESEAASKLVDLETELERAKQDSAELKAELVANTKRATEAERSAAEAERCAVESEQRAAETRLLLKQTSRREKETLKKALSEAKQDSQRARAEGERTNETLKRALEETGAERVQGLEEQLEACEDRLVSKNWRGYRMVSVLRGEGSGRIMNIELYNSREVVHGLSLSQLDSSCMR